jgi:hypothetical protein
MNTSRPNVIFSTEGFAAHAELAAHAEEKSVKLLRHAHPRTLLIRINLRLEKPHSGTPHFLARASAEGDGPDHVAHAVGVRPESAINGVVDKLERVLSACAGARKHEWHHPHAVDIPVALPKAM